MIGQLSLFLIRHLTLDALYDRLFGGSVTCCSSFDTQCFRGIDHEVGIYLLVEARLKENGTLDGAKRGSLLCGPCPKMMFNLWMNDAIHDAQLLWVLKDLGRQEWLVKPSAV